MDHDKVSVGNDEAGIVMTLVPASSVISSGEHEVGGEVRKTPTASTANTLKCKKDPLNRRFLRVRTRSVSPAAVDKAVSARDSYEEYRPHESPANSHIIDDAGDAGGICASTRVARQIRAWYVLLVPPRVLGPGYL
jgi:hypothetical protein